MHKQKVTKLGARKLHSPKSGSVSRGSERPVVRTQQKLAQVPPRPDPRVW